jgi:GTP-binding protein
LNRPIVTFSGSAVAPAQFPRDGLPEIAFLGRSNVGKSCLLNALAGVRGLARVSATPGRTQMVNFFRVEQDFYLADLPGYGYARVPEAVRSGWERLTRSYLEGREQLALCVFLVDVRHDLGEHDRTLKGYLDALHLRYVVAATKADKLGRGELQRRVNTLKSDLGATALDVMPVSATEGDGIQPLWNCIRTAAQVRREALRGH